MQPFSEMITVNKISHKSDISLTMRLIFRSALVVCVISFNHELLHTKDESNCSELC